VLEKIGKYEIRLPLGRGGMGVVYEGFDPAIGRRVAIKTLRTENIDPDDLPEFLARFKREAQSAGRLSHPHIVTIYEYGEQDGMPYIVMEYIAGRDLSVDLKRGVRFDVDDVVRMMTQLLGALGHAHEHNVVHRDIKPQNILLLEDGSLKVVDFGIARLEDGDSFTKTGLAVGTPAYMSPEQVMGMKVTAKSDLFSCGTLLYQLLTGDRPFAGDEYSVKQKILKQEPLRPSELNPLLMPPWDMVVARAMAKKPEARYDSARQMLEAIRTAHEAERREAEALRRKRIEAEEHARRAAAERSADEARKREEGARREIETREREEAESLARLKAEAAAAAEVKRRSELEDVTRRQPEKRGVGAGLWVAGAVILALVAGMALYFRQGAEEKAVTADAARVAAETLAKEEAAKRATAEALAREESEQRVKLEGEAKRQAELMEKARAEEQARVAAEEKAKAMVLKKEEDDKRKAELAAKRDAEVKARAEAEVAAKREAEEKAKAEEVAKLEAARKVAEAKAAARRPGAVIRDCPECPQMVVVPAGEFKMGSSDSEPDRDSDEGPQHVVRIPRAFAMARTEVTQAEWRAIMGANPSRFSNCGDDCPVERVNWDEAREFVRRLSEKTGRRYRLPSESEWEYACRAGGSDRYCGSGDAGNVAWFGQNSGGRTQRVAQRRPNAFGLYDMSGNVWEWTEDCWSGSYVGAPSNGSAWLSGNCSLRVVRGGAWSDEPGGVRSAIRGWFTVGYRDYVLGLRPVRTVE
jgi:formylglycine-generating enzyme required for sulfatase activity